MSRNCPLCEAEVVGTTCSSCGFELGTKAQEGGEEAQGSSRWKRSGGKRKILRPEIESAGKGDEGREATKWSGDEGGARQVASSAWSTLRGTPMALAPGWMALLVFILPSMLFALVQWRYGEEASRFRFSLLGYGFRGVEGKAFEVGIGSNPAEDEIWVANLPVVGEAVSGGVARLRFRPAEGSVVDTLDAPPAGTLHLTLGPEASRVGLIGRRGGSGALELVGAVKLEDGDVLEAGGRGWTVQFEEQSLGSRRELLNPREADQPVALPERESDLPFLLSGLDIWRSLSVQRRTHSLAQITGDGAIGSFLYRRPLESTQRELFLMPLDSELSVHRAGEPMVPPQELILQPGDRLHVLGLPRASGNIEQGGVRDLRSFRVFPGSRSMVMALDTPEIHSLGRLDLLRLESRLSVESRLKSGGKDAEEQGPLVNLAMGDWQITDEYLYLRHASRRVASQAFATLELPVGWKRELSPVPSLRAATPQGQWQWPLGKAFWLGDSAAAAVQIDVLRPSLWLGLFAILLAVGKAIAGRAVGLTVSQLLVLGGVEILVLWRLLLGWRAWALDPFEEEVMVLALVAWALLPWCLMVALLPPSGRRWTAYLPALGGWCFSLAWCLEIGANQRVAWLGCHFAALLVPLLRRGLPENYLRYLWRPWPKSERWQRALFCIGACLPFVIRLAFVLFGSRESVQVGRRFSLSLIHIPGALLLEAVYLLWLWRRVKNGRDSPWDLLPGLVIALGTWLAPAVVASDLGLALLNLPIWLLVFTWLAFSAAGRRPRGQRTFLAAIFTVYMLVAALPVGARALLSLLPDTAHSTLSSERNYLRVLEFAYPDKLRGLGVRSSEDMVIMTTTMRSYTAGAHALWGRGYTQSEISAQLGATVLREHVPAVLLAAEWGLAGTLYLLLAYGLVALAGFRVAPFRPWWNRVAGASSEVVPLATLLATLGALTLACSSLYMVLANYGLVLFTGKNTYLLGLDSVADVLESYQLLLLTVVGMAVGRDRRW